MTQVVDNVAHAIRKCIREYDEYGVDMTMEDYNDVARAAIRAMRNPTDDVVDVAQHLPRHHNMIDMWCSIIDIALGKRVVETENDTKN